MEDNAYICTWSEKTQLEKGDSVIEGYTLELWDFTRVNSTQNEFQELRDTWAQWDDEAKKLFYQNYGDLPYLLDIKVDRHLFRDMGHKAYVRPASLPAFSKKLVMTTGMSEQWAVARVQQKGDSKCIPWAVLKDLISTHPDVKKRVDVLALSIYGIVIFPKALAHIDEANTPVPAILAETLRSLSACRRASEERFIGCAQLLLVWFHSHFWKLDKLPCRVFFEGYSPLKEAVDMPRRDDILEERWIDILQNLREEDVMWKAHWLVPSEVLYRCSSFDWVPLQGIWGVIGYTSLLVIRQYRARQFIPTTQGLAQSDFSYKGDHYKKRMREISEAWKKPFCMKILTEGSTSTLEYKGWFSRRVNDNIPRLIFGVARSLEESLRVIPSEVEVMKQEFERKNLELEKRMEKLEEEKMCLSLDVDVQRWKLRREIFKAIQHEIQEERAKAEYWKQKFQEMQSRNQASLDKIEKMKCNIGGLEAALQDCELRIKRLETREEQWKGELHHLRDQVGDRDHVIEEALVQIREVAEHLQDLAIQARTLSIMYESSSDKDES
ncbi:hypothetical protein CXB51_024403 [Gossypium anomalum]|uniref:DUF7745 domain-containing protein n=1 Tax=Gossypium anomalum TaxID=47600 RepID=A0A8J6CUG3_9ROSI|nr:hypothetical protein CXB51_024403 [Gossypium anomalum]